MLKIIKDDLFLFLYLGLAILSPGIAISSTFPVIRPEFILSVFFFLYDFKLKIDYNSRILLWLIPSVLLSLVNSYLIIGIEFFFKDFMIIFQIISYIITYSVLYKYLNLSKEKGRTLDFFLFFCTISSVFSFLQVNNAFGVNEWLTVLYLDVEYAFDVFEVGLDFSHLDRVVGTVGDSRHFGMLLAFAILSAFSLKRESVLLFLIQLGICFYALLLTGSRTAIICAVAVILAWYIYFPSKKGAGFFFILFGVASFLLAQNYGLIDSDMRVFKFSDDSYDVSLAARQRDNVEFFSLIFKEPAMLFFGMGPAKTILPGSEHSDFGWFLIRFGIIGCLLYVILIIRGLVRNFRFLLTVNAANKNVLFACTISIIIWLIFCFSESIFKNSQLMAYVLFFLALGSSSLTLQKNMNNN
jgi:hypothetical protein